MYSNDINWDFIQSLLNREGNNKFKVAELLDDLALDSLYDGDTEGFNYLSSHSLALYHNSIKV